VLKFNDANSLKSGYASTLLQIRVASEGRRSMSVKTSFTIQQCNDNVRGRIAQTTGRGGGGGLRPVFTKRAKLIDQRRRDQDSVSTSRCGKIVHALLIKLHSQLLHQRIVKTEDSAEMRLILLHERKSSPTVWTAANWWAAISALRGLSKFRRLLFMSFLI